MRTLPDDVTHNLQSLDGYRALAALGVLTTHVAFSTGVVHDPIIGPITSRMDFGVCLFFLLSGFLLYRPWARSALAGTPSPSISVFTVRRALRIFPAFVVMALFTMAVLPEIQPVALPDWLSHLTLTQIYSSRPHLEGLTQVWSLATEVSFYIALPVIAWVLGRRFRGRPAASFRWQATLLLAIALISVVVNALRGWNPAFGDARWAWILPTYLDWFALGMFLVLVREARVHKRIPRFVQSLTTLANDVPTCLIIAACLYAIACTPIAGSLIPFGDLSIYSNTGPWTVLAKHELYAFCAAFLLLPAFLGTSRSSGWLGALSSPMLRYLGTISYGIFLWHLVILRLVFFLTKKPLFSGGFWWIWPTTIALSVLAASLSWFAVERPCQSLSHRFRGRHDEPLPQALPGQPQSAV